ncbi:MAG: GNAT family N-acetyltransferase [Deltaproteobacteria bacterium]|jgi:GNAT superfamily N-acetyltransferase
MRIQPTFQPVSLESIRPSRARYLDGLLEAQDALLEVFVSKSRCFAMRTANGDAGHLVVLDTGMLVEWFVGDEYDEHAHHWLPAAIHELGLTSALVKSFDHAFLSVAMEQQKSVRVRGALIRNYRRRELPRYERLRYTSRLATLEDLPCLREVRQEVFTDPERLLALVRAGGVRIFECDRGTIGFGLCRRIFADRPHVEVGIAIDERFRNRGHAPYLLRDLADRCVDDGLFPVSGCARDNEASIRVGLRVGFRARYRLLEVSF